MKRLFFVPLLALSLNVFAERYEVAVHNYGEKKFEEAFSQFMELANLGNKDAQYSIGAMYIRGEGTEKNWIEGYAWLKLASSKNNEEAMKTAEKIKKKFDENKLKRAELRYEELLKTHADDVIEERFLPKLKKTGSKSYRSMRPIKNTAPRYPQNAITKGIMGNVTIEYTVGIDGRTRFHQVRSYTSEEFIEASLEAAKQFMYEPARVGDEPVDVLSVRNRFTFRFDKDAKQEPLVNALTKLKEKAQYGSSVDRYNYAMSSQLISHFLDDKNKEKFQDYNHWNALAALDGHPAAKFELGANVLYGEQCEADKSKSHFWLTSAANDGVVEAQLLLGLERYKGVQFDKDQDEGLKWIKKAADSGRDDAKVQYALLLALHEEKNSETLPSARKYLDQVNLKKFMDELSYREINALLFSREGKFKKAIKEQKRALKLAKKYKLPVELIKSNLERLEKSTSIEKIVEA